MKLYEVPNNSKIICGGNVLDFKHIDGMYSLCYLDGERVHLHCYEDVEIVEEREEE